MQYYKVIGDLPIRFVIEMGLAACIEEWLPMARRLQKYGGVLLYERYGINRSPLSEKERTPFNIANELHELVNSINHEDKLMIIAHSQGGLYAQQYARLFSNEIGGMILIDPLSARDYEFKEKLTDKEYKKSGVDKSQNLIYMDKLAKLKLGWLIKAMMKSAHLFVILMSFQKKKKLLF